MKKIDEINTLTKKKEDSNTLHIVIKKKNNVIESVGEENERDKSIKQIEQINNSEDI